MRRVTWLALLFLPATTLAEEPPAAKPPANTPPVATGAALSLAEDTSTTGTFAVSDVDGDKLYFAIAKEPRHGSVTITDPATGAFAYTPRKDFHGEDAFTYEVGDGKLAARAVIELRVTPVNDPPEVKGGAFRAREEQAIEVRASARDVEGDDVTFSIATPPAHGTAEVVDEKAGRFRYTPEKDFHGEDRITVRATDGHDTADAEIALTVLPVNDPPVASLLTLSLVEDGTGHGVVTASDVDGDELSYRLVRAAQHGKATVEAASGEVTYQPRADFFGEDAFTIEVSDGAARTPVEVRVAVEAKNDPPVVSGGHFKTREDEAVELRAQASDVDGDALTFSIARPPARGALEIVDAKAGRFRYTPRADFHGDDRATVTVSDGQASATAELTVSVTPVNDAPVAQPLSIALEEDGEGEGTLSASDVDGDALRYRVVRGPKSGEARVSDPTRPVVHYRPRPDFFGADELTVEVSDGTAAVQVRVDVQVAARNDAPVARDLALNTAEDTPARGRVNASDIDGDALRFRVVTPPTMGEVQLDEASGALQYTPLPDRSGADAFVVEVSDGSASARANVAVEVLRVPDPPVVRDEPIETREDQAVVVRLPVEDADGDKLAFRLLSRPKRGEAALEDTALGRLRYTPRPDENGDDEIAFEVSDGRHVVRGVTRVRIVPVNDPPSVEPLEIRTTEDHAVTASLRGSDIDGDALTFRVHTPPKQGKVSFDERDPRRFVFEPARNQEGVAVFDVVAFDGEAESKPARVTVHIEGENDAPEIPRNQRFRTEEDRPYSGVLQAEDGDGDALRYRITRQPARGSVKLDDASAGRFTFTPNRDVFGNDSFSFAVIDPHGATAAGLVRVQVDEVDDPPVAMREYMDAPKYGRVTRKLKGFDPEGKPVTFRVVRQPQLGRVELRDEESGEYVFITDGSGSGTVQFEFVVNDGVNDSLPAAVVVRVR